MTTTTVQNLCYEMLLSPYYHGVANIQNSWNGTVYPIHASSCFEEYSLKLFLLVDRIVSLVVGIFLLIPLVNTLAYSLLALCESSCVDASNVHWPNLPFLFSIQPPMLDVHLNGLNQTYKIVNDHIERAAAEAENIPDPPLEVQDINGQIQPVDVTGLTSFLPRLNFTNPGLPGYRNPATVEDDGVMLDIGGHYLHEILRDKIDTIVSRIQDRRRLSGMPANHEEWEPYYQKLEKLIKHIVKYLYEERDPDIINSAIIDLACASNHCAGRHMGEAHRLYFFLKTRGSDFDNLTVEGKIKAKLATCRNQILLQFIGEREGENWTRSIFSPHIYNYYLQRIGTDLGIPGANVEYNDPYRGYSMIFPHTKIGLVKRFHKLYNPAKLHSYTYEAFNSPEHDPTAIHRDLALQWFKDQFTEPNPPAFARAYIQEKHQQVLDQHNQHFVEAQAEREAAIHEREAIHQRIEQFAGKRRTLALELIALQTRLQDYLGELNEGEKANLFNRYRVPFADRQNGAAVQRAIQQRVQMAMHLPQNSPQISHLFQGMQSQELRAFRMDISNFIAANRTANALLPNQHLTEPEILAEIANSYIGERVLEDLGEGRGQKIRPEAVVNCLTTLGFLQTR